MPTNRLTIARDYNQGLPFPIRWAHVACTAFWQIGGPIHRWVHHPVRQYWAFPAFISLMALLFGTMLFGGALDMAITRALRMLVTGGDIRRELETLQQWGAVGSIVIASIVIWQVDRARRLRLLDWYAAMAVLFAVVNGLKMFFGRPRPSAAITGPDGTVHEFPGELLWPWGAWPLDGRGVVHAWEFWRGISSDLWSMPSSHTAFAVAMSVFIGHTYPRLRGLAIGMAIIVGFARIILGAHYPADVVVGACVGFAIATAAVRFRWGRRILKRRRRARRLH